MPIKIDFISNVRDLLRGTKDAVDAFDDVADSLDDVARDGDRDLTKLEKSFKEIADESRDTGRDIGRNMDAGMDKAKSATRGLGEEAGQTSREMAASFDGSIESIGDGFQELAANGMAGLGPAGIAAGAAVALAMGTAFEAINKAKEATDEATESTYEYALSAAAAGGYVDFSDRINDLTGSIEGLKRVQDIATISGWDQQEVIKAMATGDGLPALTAAFAEGANSTTIATNRALELQGALDGTAQGFKLAATGADLQAQALYDLTIQTGQASGEVDELGNAIYTMPDGKQVVVDAETQTAHAELTAFEQRQLPPKEVELRVRVNRGEWDNWVPNLKTGVVMAQIPRGINQVG